MLDTPVSPPNTARLPIKSILGNLRHTRQPPPGVYRHWRYPAWRYGLAPLQHTRYSPMLAAVDDQGRSREEIDAGEGTPRRIYPPAEVQGRLGVSASGLRRLAGIYERSVGPLGRNERGRVWSEEAVEALEVARAAVREQRAVSIEAALKGQDLDVTAPEASPVPAASPQEAPQDVGAAILEELVALRLLVEEQNRRIGELEEAVRTGRELPAVEATEPQDGPEGPSEGSSPKDLPEDAGAPVQREERGAWRRLLDWFGF